MRILLMWHLNLVIFYLPILILPFFYFYLFWKFQVSDLIGRKVWILKDPLILVPQIMLSFIFPS